MGHGQQRGRQGGGRGNRSCLRYEKKRCLSPSRVFEVGATNLRDATDSGGDCRHRCHLGDDTRVRWNDGGGARTCLGHRRAVESGSLGGVDWDLSRAHCGSGREKFKMICSWCERKWSHSLERLRGHRRRCRFSLFCRTSACGTRAICGACT